MIREQLLALGAATTLACSMAGCGSAPVSQTLVDARRSVHAAQRGVAARLEPDEVRIAERSLAEAEAAADGSEVERHHAYLADRQARLATAHASAEAVAHDQEAQQSEYYEDLEQTAVSRAQELDEREDELTRLRAELDEVRGRLEERGDTLDAQTRQLQAREAELSERLDELTAEREARVQAEERMRAAMSELQDLAEIQEERDQWVITLNGEILFETNRSKLRSTATRRLEQVAEALADSEQAEITIEGHTDSRGPDANNERLSRARAQSVSEFLVSHGIEADRITVVGRGESEPVADNGTPEGRANNRRVEIIVQRHG